jgi:phage-related protein
MASRELVWVGSSKDDISRMPDAVKMSFGYRLREVQSDKTPLDMRPLSQFGKGVYELRERFEGNAYRLVYTVGLKKVVYALHAFMKKSKSGIGIPKRDAELIEARFKQACRIDAGG